jgi:uncharacterized protein (DUF885 family)
MRILPWLVSLAFLSSCASAPKTAPRQETPLQSIISDYSKSAMRLDPFYAPYFNIEEDLPKFGDYPSPEFKARSKTLVVQTLDRLKTINPATLDAEEKITYALFKDDLEVSLRSYDFSSELLDFNQMSNRLHSYLDDSSKELTSFPFDSVKHYDDFVERSKGFPAYVDRQIETLRRGIREGIVASCVVVKAVPNSYKDGLESEVEKHPFYRPIHFMPETFPKAERERLTAAYAEMVRTRIQPGIRKFDAFFRNEYSPHCRKAYGIGSLPNGKAWYAHSIRSSTNLELDPKTIHETGLKEVARITAGMEKIKAELGFKGTLAEFRASLAKDPKSYYGSARELLDAFERMKAVVTAKLPQYFERIPKTDYKIVESSNPEDAAASYNSPTDLLPYGRFVVNTKNLHIVPIYEVSTLSLHEAIPGHHMQIAIQFEAKDRLSDYRRKLYFSNAFVEGWALYAEYLGNEMGLFQDPLQRFGHLNDEMLRAVRLVVDTGIHAYGWNRERTITFMKKHLATPEADISNEANRYSVWPGQALAYKTGQMKILELRRLAEKELGPRFDIRGFHEAVIGNGTLSLGVLETQVKIWIESRRK